MAKPRQKYFTSVIKPEDGSRVMEEFRNLYEWINQNPDTILIDIKTTDASVTDIAAILVSEGDVFFIEVWVIGKKSDESQRAYYHLEGLFYRNTSGNVTQQGSTTSLSTIESDANWNTTLNADTTAQTIDVRITGVAATTIFWKAIIKYQRIA